MITKAQSRVVRDATLKRTNRQFNAVFDRLIQGEPSAPTPSKAAKLLYGAMWDGFRREGIAAFRVSKHIRNKPKRFNGYLGEWAVLAESQRLACDMLRIYFDKEPEIEFLTVMSISRHSIERVSERLGTLDPQAIRDELCAVPAAFFAEQYLVGLEPLEHGKYISKTPHGIAVIAYEEDEMVVTTWISDATAGKKFLGEWHQITGGSSKQGRVNIETANDAKVYRLRRKS